MNTLIRDLKILKGLLLKLVMYLLLIDIVVVIITVLFRTHNVNAILTNSEGNLLTVFLTMNFGFLIVTVIAYITIWRKEIQEAIDNNCKR